MFAEGINVEVGAKPIGVGDGLILETNSQLMPWVSGGAGNQCLHMFFREADEDNAILTGIGREDIGESWCDDHEETILTQSPGRVLARGPAGEVLLCD